MFETVNNDDGRRTDAGPWIYYKLTYEPSAQVSYIYIIFHQYFPVFQNFFEGWSLVLNASVHDLCILFTWYIINCFFFG